MYSRGVRSDATSEVGTSGRGMDPGYALQSRIFRRRKHHQTEVALLWRTGLGRSRRHLKPANQHQTGPRWGPKSPRYTVLPRSTQRMKVLRVARRAIRQFCRGNVLWHKGQVINSEPQLAVILGQRVVDKVRVTINVDAQQTPCKRQGAAETQHPLLDLCGSLSCASRRWLGPFVRYCLKGLVGSFLPALGISRSTSILCFARADRDLMLKYLNHHSVHAAGLQGTRIPGDRAEFTSTLDLFDANSLRYHVMHCGDGSESMEQVNKCTGVSLMLDTRVCPVDRIVHRLTPPRKLQGRLGGVVVRRRSTEVQNDFHEKVDRGIRTSRERGPEASFAALAYSNGVEPGATSPCKHDHHDGGQWTHWPRQRTGSKS